MKRLIAVLLLLTIIPNANAAISVKPMVQLGAVDAAAIGVVASNNAILTFGNRDKNGFAQILNGATVDLTAGAESFVTAANVDADGNFILVGAASKLITTTPPSTTGILNPDNVVPDPNSSNKSDANTLWYWKLDASGKILDSQSMDMPSTVIPRAVLADKFGITVAGVEATSLVTSKTFVVNWNQTPTYLGKNSTKVFDIARTSDGGVVAVGQSAEKLLDKPLKGKADGFLAKFLNGKVTNVQRSSDLNANRGWVKTSSTLLLGGFSNKSAVVTKFASNFSPIWTSRYPSLGSSLTATIGKANYAAFIPNGSIATLPTWRKKNLPLVLTFDNKGAITAANYVNNPNFIGFTASATYGPIVMAGGFLYRA